MFELAVQGPTSGNPFTDVRFAARFYQDDTSVEATGFYDGDGVYRVRFMPAKQGVWHYITSSSAPALDGKTGEFTVTTPSAGDHGPVRVAHAYHFAYADGTPFKELGTTCYAWIHQPEALQEETLKTLASAPFNKIRFCVFPKHYAWNTNEPVLYPYDRGHWGFDRMPAIDDDLYLRYVVARLSAYRNVWWSLANEWDFMKEKTEADFVRFGEIVSGNDPYHHLLSIHNGSLIFNHNLPWITHVSIQNGSAVEDPGRAELYRDVYRKPVVYDEIKYEGNIPLRWGNLSAEELVFRFWNGTVAGTYVGHGETCLSPADLTWRSGSSGFKNSQRALA